VAHGRANRQVVHRAHDPAAVAADSAHAAVAVDIAVVAVDKDTAVVAHAGRVRLSSVSRKRQR